MVKYKSKTLESNKLRIQKNNATYKYVEQFLKLTLKPLPLLLSKLYKK